jgi:hypothetical protein
MLLSDRACSLEQWLGLLIPALLKIQDRQIGEGISYLRMLQAQVLPCSR